DRVLIRVFVVYCSGAHPHLLSFPTRRSSDLDQVTPELFQALRRLEPFGVGNPEPVFIARDVFVKAPPRIMKERHVKLRLSAGESDRKSTRLNSSHVEISYAVFCLKKKTQNTM